MIGNLCLICKEEIILSEENDCQDPGSDRPKRELVFIPFQFTVIIATASNGPSAREVSLVLILEYSYVFAI